MFRELSLCPSFVPTLLLIRDLLPSNWSVNTFSHFSFSFLLIYWYFKKCGSCAVAIYCIVFGLVYFEHKDLPQLCFPNKCNLTIYQIYCRLHFFALFCQKKSMSPWSSLFFFFFYYKINFYILLVAHHFFSCACSVILYKATTKKSVSVLIDPVAMYLAKYQCNVSLFCIQYKAYTTLSL